MLVHLSGPFGKHTQLSMHEGHYYYQCAAGLKDTQMVWSDLIETALM